MEIDYKSLTRSELQHVFSDIDFLLEPMRHQFISLAFASERDRIFFFHSVGTGKTICSLYSVKLWECKKTIVITPSSAFGSWKRDIENYTNFSYVILTGSGRERKRNLKKKKDIFVVNYEGLKVLYARLYKEKGWEILPESFIHDFDCIILDEIHKCKNFSALQSRICLELSKRAKYVIGLTGTPIDKSFLELFNIVKTVDLGKSLGTNFFSYRRQYFDKRICGSKWGRKWIEWELKPGCEEKILNKISNITLSFSREECFELPSIQEIVKYIHPSDQFSAIQLDIVEENITKINGDEIDFGEDINSKAFKLRELPNGFFYYGKGEDRRTYRLKKNPKAEALLDLLEDTDSKIVVFYQFTEERAILEEALEKEGVCYSSAFGGQSSEDREREIKKFFENGKVRVFLSQITCASEGFDAYVANIAVFFSPLSSPKMRKQCIGRIYRRGQQKKCLVLDFVLEGSFDQKIVEKRGERFDLVKMAMEYIGDFHKNSNI